MEPSESAEARAAEAEARAEELRRRIDELESSNSDSTASGAPRRVVATLIAGLATVALLAATGYMLVAHQTATRQRHQQAEYAAAARQGVINLMSVNFETASESVQRVIDGSTGRFRTNFEETADEFVKALQDEKIVTRATVNDAAVESVSDDTAVVLVSATSQREGARAPKEQQQPRVWRVVVALKREGEQIKMSAVDFV